MAYLTDSYLNKWFIWSLRPLNLPLLDGSELRSPVYQGVSVS